MLKGKSDVLFYACLQAVQFIKIKRGKRRLAFLSSASCQLNFLWHRVVAAAAPGMAAPNAINGKPETLEESVFFKSLHAVGTASRRKTA